MLRFCEEVTQKVRGDFEADHVHLLVFYPPKVSVSALVNSPQGRFLPQAPLRVRGAGEPGADERAFLVAVLLRRASCGGAPLSIIRQYTEQQQRPA